MASRVVPGPTPESSEPTQLRLVFDGEATELEVRSKPASRHAWAWLLRRVFAVDVLTCAKCQGPMSLKEVAKTPEAIARVLAEVGLGPRPPRPRRPPPRQLEFDLTA